MKFIFSLQLLSRVYGLFHVRQGNGLWEKSITMELDGVNDTVGYHSIASALNQV